jgi:hypothetical protein
MLMTRRIDEISNDIQRTRAEVHAIPEPAKCSAADITRKAQLQRKLLALADEKREWIRSGEVEVAAA